jgi:transcriptional regulator with XRE-family HTH domain
MKATQNAVWDGRLGTAGGAAFGAALTAFSREREVSPAKLAEALETDVAHVAGILSGSERIGIAGLARLAHALRAKPIEFLQKTAMLSLEAYAFGLDPLYFLPEGQTRYDARIYMREINPRHQVPENDMTKRNATLKAVTEDVLLDPLGKTEVELAYLLRTAVQQTGGTL